jgi:glucose uptake protein GlcU
MMGIIAQETIYLMKKKKRKRKMKTVVAKIVLALVQRMMLHQ